MMPSPTRLVLLLVFVGVAVYLFTRAMAGGGPLYYFLSAVFLGMAIAALQRGSGGRGQGGREPDDRPTNGRGPGSKGG